MSTSRWQLLLAIYFSGVYSSSLGRNCHTVRFVPVAGLKFGLNKPITHEPFAQSCSVCSHQGIGTSVIWLMQYGVSEGQPNKERKNRYHKGGVSPQYVPMFLSSVVYLPHFNISLSHNITCSIHTQVVSIPHTIYSLAES